MMSQRTSAAALAAIGFLVLAGSAAPPAGAADWSDTAISWRYGQRFREPYNPADIKKHIFALTHASGYKYGSNYFNVDLLQSDSNDPGSLNQTDGAQEAYIVYRHTLDIGALRGAPIAYGAVKGVGLVLGFDWNTKNDVGYNSRKRMLVAGPDPDVGRAGLPQHRRPAAPREQCAERRLPADFGRAQPLYL
jgi:hypothetical protein